MKSKWECTEDGTGAGRSLRHDAHATPSGCLRRLTLSPRRSRCSGSLVSPLPPYSCSPSNHLPFHPLIRPTTLASPPPVRRFATDVVGPKVRAMDEAEMMDPAVISGLFEQGLMGIETSSDLGGAESSFTSAIIAIEELAKVDPSVSVLCDVHNTLVNTVVRKYGNNEQRERWLPLLSESQVGVVFFLVVLCFPLLFAFLRSPPTTRSVRPNHPHHNRRLTSPLPVIRSRNDTWSSVPRPFASDTPVYPASPHVNVTSLSVAL